MASGSSEAGALLFWTSLEKAPLSFPFRMLPCHKNQVSDKMSYRGPALPLPREGSSPFFLLACSPTLNRQSECLPTPSLGILCVFLLVLGYLAFKRLELEIPEPC